MIFKTNHDSIEIEAESPLEPTHEIELFYLKQFEGARVSAESDARGHIFRLKLEQSKKRG